MVKIMEEALMFLAIVIVGTQIFWPIVTGRKLFPTFRRSTYEERRLAQAALKEKRAAEQLEVARREAHAQELQEEAERVQDRAHAKLMEELRGPSKPQRKEPEKG